MFVKTVKVKSVIKILLLSCVALLAVLILLAVFNRVDFGNNKLVLDDTQKQIAFLQSLGWEVAEEPTSERDIIIPQEWNAVYEEYNNLQLQQGFDLDRYRGKQAIVVTYSILNYDGCPDAYATLILFDGVLIGGDVSCAELGGFMHGLCPIDSE